MSAVEDIEEQAAQWLAREDRGLDAAGQRELEDWLATSSSYRISYLRLKAVWRRADRLAVLKTPTVPAHAVSTDFRRRAYRIVTLAAAGAAVLCLAILGTFIYEMPRSHPYLTRVGEQKMVNLADGSQIELNTNTRLSLMMTPSRRTVTLDRGEAYFEVKHNAARPFTVIVGGYEVADLGTRFSVWRLKDGIRVIIAQGRVRISMPGNTHSAPISAGAGDIVFAKYDGALITHHSPQDIDALLSWRGGLLVFNREALADVAQDFNRYNERQLIVKGDARAIRLGGSFRADNLDAFTALIREGFGLTVDKQDKKIIITGR